MKELLRSYGITPTATRLRVWEFLEDNTSHPTADDVLRGITANGEKISRATVYNTLNLFSERGLLCEIHGNDDVVHFDPCTTSHAHFQCVRCHKIWDLDFDDKIIDLGPIKEAKIQSVCVLAKGVCPDCNRD